MLFQIRKRDGAIETFGVATGRPHRWRRPLISSPPSSSHVRVAAVVLLLKQQTEVQYDECMHSRSKDIDNWEGDDVVIGGVFYLIFTPMGERVHSIR